MNYQKKIDYISKWIKEYATSLSFQPVSLVIGVSGGIDSAVTSALCAKTGFKTIAISMPIKQNLNQHDLSLKHLDWLKKMLLVAHKTTTYRTTLEKSQSQFPCRQDHQVGLEEYQM